MTKKYIKMQDLLLHRKYICLKLGSPGLEVQHLKVCEVNLGPLRTLMLSLSHSSISQEGTT